MRCARQRRLPGQIAAPRRKPQTAAPDPLTPRALRPSAVSPSLKNLLLSVLAGGSVLSVIAIAVVAGALHAANARLAPGADTLSAFGADTLSAFFAPAVSSFDRVVRK